MEIRQLEISDIHPNMLNYFNRYQEVTQCWRKNGDNRALENVSYIRDWDEDKKKWVINLNAKKLYISAHSAKDSIAFYKKMGCKDAQEIFQELIDEPYNWQLEYELCHSGNV